jgi:hypothetical protein
MSARHRVLGGVCGGDPVPDASGPDADPTCACAGNSLTCAGKNVACALGCKDGAPARCARLIPSNHVNGVLGGCIATNVEPLVGGSGGAGGGAGVTGAHGGGGGGAIQISAMGTITFAGGSIDVGGGGGEGGPGDPAGINAGAGGGGGGGGAILLEAIEIEIEIDATSLFGGGFTDQNGKPGQSGRLSNVAALGGNPGGGTATAGGAGGSIVAPTQGGDNAAPGTNAGGGGGRIHFNTLAATPQTVLASPQASWRAIQHE